MIQIPQGVWNDIVAHVESGYPNECCGIFGGNVSGSEPLMLVAGSSRALNLNKERSRDRYLMNPKDIVSAQKHYAVAGQDIVGYYHSHPDHPAAPSETDRVNAWSGYSYVIISVQKGKVAKYTSWVLNEKTQQFEEEKIVIASEAKQSR